MFLFIPLLVPCDHFGNSFPSALRSSSAQQCPVRWRRRRRRRPPPAIEAGEEVCRREEDKEGEEGASRSLLVRSWSFFASWKEEGRERGEGRAAREETERKKRDRGAEDDVDPVALEAKHGAIRGRRHMCLVRAPG